MTIYTNEKNRKNLQSLPTKRQKTEFMIGGRVTVGRITQVKDNSLVHKFHPRIRGIFVGRESYPTREEARQAGLELMDYWKNEHEMMKKPIRHILQKITRR